MDSMEQVISEGTKRLSTFGHDLDVATREGITLRLIEKFSEGIFPLPHEFSDREITTIGQWGGLDDDGTFGVFRDEPQSRTEDYRIIEEYKLDVAAGENTWSRFAAILKSRKELWAQSHPKDAALLHGRELLEEAVEKCAIAGMTESEIMTETQRWCDERFANSI